MEEDEIIVRFGFTIALHPGWNENAFEGYLYEELLPYTALSIRLASRWRHLLFKGDEHHGRREYLWILEIYSYYSHEEWESYGGPENGWLAEVYQEVRFYLEPCCTISSSFKEVASVEHGYTHSPEGELAGEIRYRSVRRQKPSAPELEPIDVPSVEISEWTHHGGPVPEPRRLSKDG